jgi:hypothetical protein
VGQEALSVGGSSVAQSVHLSAALEDSGRAHAGADAHGDHAKSGPLAALVHLVQQRRCAARACNSSFEKISA